MVSRLLIRGLVAALLVLALPACAPFNRGGPMPLPDYRPEAFGATTHVRHFLASYERTCEAARRALLSQGYVVTAAASDGVAARKYFQPDAEHHVQLEFRVVCAPEEDDPRSSVAFISGLTEQYIVRKVKDSASLGVGGIGSLSLPIEGSMDSMVKVASATISESTIYDRLFALMAGFLDSSRSQFKTSGTAASS